MAFQLAQAHDRPHRLHVIAVGLGFQIDVLDVIGDALLFLFEALDALDEEAQLFGGDIVLAHILTPVDVNRIAVL
jgi:hypothetical protein